MRRECDSLSQFEISDQWTRTMGMSLFQCERSRREQRAVVHEVLAERRELITRHLDTFRHHYHQRQLATMTVHSHVQPSAFRKVLHVGVVPTPNASHLYESSNHVGCLAVSEESHLRDVHKATDIGDFSIRALLRTRYASGAAQ